MAKRTNEMNVESKKPNDVKDVSVNQGDNLETPKELTPDEQKQLALENLLKIGVDTEKASAAKSRQRDARTAAKNAHIKKYTGNVKGFLLARVTVVNTNSETYYDFDFSYTDKDGNSVPMHGKASVTSLFSADANKAFRKAAKSIKSAVVPFQNGADDKEKAKIRNSIMNDAKLMFSYLGIEKDSVLKRDVNAILANAYIINASGNDDAKNENTVIMAACYVAKRLHEKREAINAEKARQDAKDAKKENKTK